MLIAVFVCGLLLGVVAHSEVNNLVQIPNVGNIRSVGVEVYADEALSQILNEITWDTLDPGEARMSFRPEKEQYTRFRSYTISS